VHIGLFTESDLHTRGGLAAAVDSLAAYRPHDMCIHRYSALPTVGGALRSFRQIVKQVDADRIDVVHVATSGPLAIAPLLVASRFGLPIIGSFDPPVPTSSRSFTVCLRALVRQCRRLLVTSMAARDMFVRAKIDASKIVVWRPGVDSAMFAPSMRSSALRERWGVSDGRPAIICAGALSDDRGAQRILSLELALHRTRPMHQLIVVGDGPSRNAVQARCPNAIFMGPVPRAEMPRVLASGDLFVCPSEAASTNLTVLEAQASGLPVVAMERGSARERVAGPTAIVCRSQADFIVETAALVRTDARRNAMALASRKYAIRQDWAAGLSSVYAEYRSASEVSRLRRDLEPAFVPQGRRL
jgi:glycosyltransferase involved in cell wall biosynthesis